MSTQGVGRDCKCSDSVAGVGNLPPPGVVLSDFDKGELLALCDGGLIFRKHLNSLWPKSFTKDGTVKHDDLPLGRPHISHDSNNVPRFSSFGKRILCGQDYHAAHPEFEVLGASSESQTQLSIHMAVPADLSIVQPPGFTDPPRMMRQYAVHQLYPDTYDTYIYNLS
ncbi:Meiosis-specific protein HOP1 [Elsinoe australis]|uniref:Meiosis-specific protein HOP1 n=1 Tax=Elsinoe australis TaxID=40998 RepID=A0A2P7YJN2_9PEZI|nr:Meiosis-specific protein HOP1 [Elsinoe australis]